MTTNLGTPSPTDRICNRSAMQVFPQKKHCYNTKQQVTYAVWHITGASLKWITNLHSRKVHSNKQVLSHADGTPLPLPYLGHVSVSIAEYRLSSSIFH